MTGSTVATTGTAVPALANTPALDITAEDIALPRLYIGQFMSEAVKEQLVKAGTLFAATGPDDPDPIVIWDPSKKGDNPGVRVHVLDLRKGRSASIGGELQLFDYNDQDAPEDSWVTYNYTVAVPDVDTEVPHKWLLTRTGKATAQRMNKVLAKAVNKVPQYTIAFEVTTQPRENNKGKFFVPVVKQVEATPEHIKVAEELLVMVSGRSAEFKSTGDEPAI